MSFPHLFGQFYEERKMEAKDYFKEEWNVVFELDDKSPSGVIWKNLRKSHLIGKSEG